MSDENNISVYPFPDKAEEWEASLQEAFEKEFLTVEEMNTCLEQGYMSLSLLAQIHAKIISFSCYSRLMFIIHWMKIKKNINLSDDDWIRYNL